MERVVRTITRAAAALLLLGMLAPDPPVSAAGTGRIFVSSERDHGVVVLDGKTLEKVGFVKTGKRVRHMQASADRKLLYVCASDSNRVDVIDMETLKVVDRLDVGPDPEVFDISPDGKTMYVSNEDDAELTLFDMAAKKKTGVDNLGAMLSLWIFSPYKTQRSDSPGPIVEKVNVKG
jgi:YVTN family beta-propeller protein